MSATVKLAAKLEGDPTINGLDAFHDRLIEQPDEPLVVVAWLDTQKVTRDTDTGDEVPTVRVRRIEPLGDLDDVPQAVQDAVATAVQRRTGRKAIPFTTVEVVEGYDSEQTTIDD